MKIHNKTDLQQTAINHSADFMKICKEGTGEPYYILTAGTTLPASDPLRFRKNLLDLL